jgi:hypothetical protein
MTWVSPVSAVDDINDTVTSYSPPPMSEIPDSVKLSGDKMWNLVILFNKIYASQ